MHRAHHARIERTHDVLHRDGRGFALLHGGTHQCGLQRAGRACAVTRGEVPAGGRNDLIARNAPAANGQPMPQAATGCLAQTHGVGVAGQHGLGTAGRAGHDGTQAVFGQQHQLRQLHGACEHTRKYIAPAALPQCAQQRLPLRQLARQRSGLQYLARQARCLVPGVGARLVDVGLCLPLRGVQRARAVGQPGVSGVFGNVRKIHAAQLLAIPCARGHGKAALRIGKSTVAQREVRAAPQRIQPQVSGNAQKQAQITLVRVALQPVGQGRLAGKGRHLFQRCAIQHAFQKTAHLGHARAQAHPLGRCQVARAAPRHDRLGVRPFATQRSHDVHPALAHGQRLARMVSRQRGKTLHRLAMPGAARIHLAREVGHEEQIKMRQVV